MYITNPVWDVELVQRRNIYILLLLGDTNEYTLIIDNVLSLYNYSIQISLSPWLERI